MKSLLIFACLLLGSQMVMAQKKGKEDPKDLKIDSLMTVNKGLNTQLDEANKTLMNTVKSLDSTTMVLGKYEGLYKTIKAKVMDGKDFDPTASEKIIDSLRMSRETAMAASKAPLTDSINHLLKKNLELQTAVDSMSAAGADKTPLINELKQLKELLDAGIITQEEFDVRKTKILERW